MFDFGTLRSFLNQPPSAHRWAELCQRMEQTARRQPELTREVLIPYTLDHLARGWPVTLRPTPERWLDRLLRPAPVEEYVNARHRQAREQDRANTDIALGLLQQLTLDFEGHANIAPLCAARHLGSVRDLTLQHAGEEPLELETLAASASFQRLDALRVTNAHITPAGIGALLDAPWSRPLRTLRLSDVRATTAMILAMRDAELPDLRDLSIHVHMRLDPWESSMLDALLSAPWLPQLEHVQWYGPEPTPAQLRRLQDIPFTRLKDFYVATRDVALTQALAALATPAPSP